MNILLADDNLDIREFLCEALSLQGHKVFDFTNGQLALDYFNHTTEKVHLILSDIMMPVLNGIELSQFIRSQNKDIPIILITGFSSPELKKEAQELNVIVLPKPIDFTSLEHLINTI